MIDELLTLLWRSLTADSLDTETDVVVLLVDGYFLQVSDCEWDALGDTIEDAETELRHIAANDFQLEWDHHFWRGTDLLSQVESLAEVW